VARLMAMTDVWNKPLSAYHLEWGKLEFSRLIGHGPDIWQG
jgi:hypothetical protein